MRMVFLVFLVLFLSVPAIADEPKTVIHDQKEAELLLGRHLFTSSQTFYSDNGLEGHDALGEAYVTNDKGLYKISGYHENYYQPYRSENPKERSGGYVEIDGIITEIQPHYFIFKGKIETGVIERKLTENEILERVEVGLSRKEMEEYRLTSTTDPDIKKYLNICVRPQNRLYKFARVRYSDKVSFPDYPTYWRLQTPQVPDSCNRFWINGYEAIDIFTKHIEH